MKNFIFVMALLCIYSFTQAQQVGKPAGNNPVSNFFNSSAAANGGGGQLGHLQTTNGTFGDLTGSSEWISIGQSNFGPFYGMRVQKGADFGTFSVNTDGNSEDLEILWGGSSANDFNFKYAANVTQPATKIMTLKSSGNVGIGTDNPTSPLHVQNTTTHLAQFIQGVSAGRDAYITIRGARNGTTNNNLTYINLDNFDNNEAGGTAFTMARVSSGMEAPSGQTGFLRFYTNQGASLQEKMRIKGNGNVGIGKTNPIEKLEVGGNVLANNYFTHSDRRYKDKIENLQQPMDLLNSINGVSYEYKRGEFPEQDFKEGKSMGFIAQDFEKALPELLIQNDEGFYAVNYDGVIPILVEAVKELNGSLDVKNREAEDNDAKIRNLEETIKVDEIKIQNLENEVNELKTLFKELIASQDLNQAGKATNNALPSLNKSELFQNAPNPSNGNTEISYSVEGKANNIMIDIYDADGKMIQRFDNLPTGKNSVSLSENLQPGIYFYTLFTDGQEIATKRMVVMK